MAQKRSLLGGNADFAEDGAGAGAGGTAGAYGGGMAASPSSTSGGGGGSASSEWVGRHLPTVQSAVVNGRMVAALRTHLPPHLQEYVWHQQYSLARHGASLQTLLGAASR